jgi:hypothetical protein
MLSSACNEEAESNMKIYLLVMLMSALLMAIRFTTALEQQSNSTPSKGPLQPAGWRGSGSCMSGDVPKSKIPCPIWQSIKAAASLSFSP